jgi:hypothetical protein
MALPTARSSVSESSQQGSLDWTALSNTAFSASVAVLARFSGAGIEPLTVVVGRAVCGCIPLSGHGETKLRETMSGLKDFSSFSNLISFGTGARHILRELTETSEGCSMVALAACLVEGFSEQFAARVFMNLAKLRNVPAQLSPSFAQWEAVVKACSGVMSCTSFGIRIAALLRLSGQHVPYSKQDIIEPDPSGLANLLYAVGQVVHGDIERIEVTGAGDSIWVIVFCEFFLGLRVRIISYEGAVVFDSSKNTGNEPQIVLQVWKVSKGAAAANKRLTVSGRVYQFNLEPLQLFQKFSPFGETNWLHEHHGMYGRVKWESVLEECFSSALKAVIDRATIRRAFVGIFSCAAVIFSSSSVTGLAYRDPIDFVHGSILLLPELGHFQEELVQYTRSLALHGIKELGSIYEHSWKVLAMNCSCQSTKVGLPEDCVLVFAELVAILAGALQQANFDTPLHLSHRGLLILNDRIFNSICREQHTNLFDYNVPYEKGTLKHLPFVLYDIFDGYNIPGTYDTHSKAYPVKDNVMSRLGADKFLEVRGLAQFFILIFSGRPATKEPASAEKVSAMAMNGIYCYSALLCELSDAPNICFRVHIGQGTIRCGSHIYTSVKDMDHGSKLPVHDTDIEYTEGFPRTTMNKASGRMSISAFVEESIDLHFWYEVFDSSFRLPVNICKVLEGLEKAHSHKTPLRTNEIFLKDRPMDVLKDQIIRRVVMTTKSSLTYSPCPVLLINRGDRVLFQKLITPTARCVCLGNQRLDQIGSQYFLIDNKQDLQNCLWLLMYRPPKWLYNETPDATQAGDVNAEAKLEKQFRSCLTRTTFILSEDVPDSLIL